VFSKELVDIAWGMNRCLARLGALPKELVWDREGAIHAGGGRPTEGFAVYCGQLEVGWVILDPGDAQAKGALERTHRFMSISRDVPVVASRLWSDYARLHLRRRSDCDPQSQRPRHRAARHEPRA